MLGLIKEELLEISERYGDERRTEITHAEDDVDIEDLIADQQMVIAITHSGYIKSLPLATYRMQRRGGVGVTGMDMKDDDYIEHLFVCSTHDFLLFFTNRGKVYRSKVYELPEAGRTSKGRYLGNVLPLREGERVQSVLATRDFSESDYLVFATRRGTVKKTEFQAYNTPIKADGIIAIKIRDEDELVAVRRVDEGDEVLMVSSAGLTVRFAESDARAMGRDTSGVRGMDVSGDVDVIAMDIARDDQYLLVVTENGFGKRTLVDRVPQDAARRQGRQDDPADRGQGPAGRRARRARAPPARVHLPERHGPADRGARLPPARPQRPGLPAHEHPRGRPGVRRSRSSWRRRPRPPRAPRRSIPRPSPAPPTTRRWRRPTTPTCSRRPARPTRPTRRR